MASSTTSTALHMAVKSGDMNKVRRLLRSGKYDNIDCTDSNGQTPLHYACAAGHLDIVIVLIAEFNACMFLKDKNGCIPLMTACLYGRRDVAFSLVTDHLYPRDVKDNKNRTVLHYACGGGNVGLVQFLIRDHNADIGARDDKNNTPLHVAALSGKKEVALSLINEFGCDITVKGFLGRSLLHNACAGGNVSLVQFLICNHNADIGARDDENNTPLHVAALYGKKDMTLYLLNEFGCVVGGLGRSLLHCACAGGNVRLVESLMYLYSETYARDDENSTPFHVAALYGKKEVVLSLINKFGFDITIKGCLGRSLLHYACRGGNVSLVQCLICDYNADINARDDENNTPLHVAALYGKKEAALSLIMNLVVILLSKVFWVDPCYIMHVLEVMLV